MSADLLSQEGQRRLDQEMLGPQAGSKAANEIPPAALFVTVICGFCDGARSIERACPAPGCLGGDHYHDGVCGKCSRCNGRGTITEPCEACNGTGNVEVEEATHG